MASDNEKKRETELSFSRKLICVTGCFSVTCTVRVAEITEKKYKIYLFIKNIWTPTMSQTLF